MNVGNIASMYAFSPLYMGVPLNFYVKKDRIFFAELVVCCIAYVLHASYVSVGCTTSWFIDVHSLRGSVSYL